MAEKKTSEEQVPAANLPFISGKSPEIVIFREQETPVQATDKTVPGGRYIVDGKLVNSDGSPLRSSCG